MLENDIEMVENAVARSAPGSKLWDAWNRIKKELSGSGQNSAALSNYEICVSCMDQPAMLCLSCAKKSALPSGETNTTKVQICPECEGLGYTEPTLQDPDGLCPKCRGAGKL